LKKKAKKKKFTYKDSGVDRNLRRRSKRPLDKILEPTRRLSCYGKIIQLPFNSLIPTGRSSWFDLVIEGVGTKVLVAQLADKYDTIGIDGVAMAVNDVIRSGANPLGVGDNIHAVESNPFLVKEWLKGVAKGAIEAQCPVSGGEIGDVAEIIKGVLEGKGFDMVVATVGEILHKEQIVYGDNIVAGDVVVGLRSSGLHSNGISLARKVLFKQWGGKFEPFDIPEGFGREIVLEALESTKIYVKPVIITARSCKIKAAVHITGDAYLKFRELMKFSRGIGFCFNNFRPQPIFDLIQKTAPEVKGTVTDEEMFKTFNMGWGFALITARENSDRAITILEKNGAEAEVIGEVNDSSGIVIEYKKKKIRLY
jgi:phosphoribosylformylglycinamidine cyclo-ligase